MTQLILPEPLEHQRPVLDSPARFKLWRAGRRTGKSRAELIAGVAGHGPDRMRRGMLQAGAVAWFAPDYKQAQAIWREEIRPRFGGLPWAEVSESEKRVSIRGVGGWLQLLSAENIDAARGWKLDGAICDEGGYWDLEYGWNAVIRPALADRQGWAMFGSTTNAGHDGNQAKRVPSYFNLLCERVEKGQAADDWAAFHNVTDDNVTIPREEIQALRSEYPADSATAMQEFDAALGVAGGRYYQVDERVHLIPRLRLPDPLPAYWDYYGAFDWGFAHWAVFGAFAVDTDGTTYLLDTLWMRREQDDEYARRIQAAVGDGEIPAKCLAMVYAGHDCWNKVTARGASGVTTYDVFLRSGILLRKADIDRVNGGRALRRALAFHDDKGGDAERTPTLYLVDTPGNKRVLAQLEAILPADNDVNAPMKVDAIDGKGGDDGADMLRYGIASKRRQPVAPVPELDDWNPITPEIHRVNYERSRKLPPRRLNDLMDPDFGAY